MSSNEPEITNHKSITENSVILNAVDMLLTCIGIRNRSNMNNKFLSDWMNRNQVIKSKTKF